MKIAVNTRLLLKNKLEGIGWFTFEVLKRMVKSHPEVEFLFLFDRPFCKEFIFESNVKGIVVFPQARHPFLYHWWFEYSLPKVMKKENVDVFFSPEGFVSLRSKIPSINVIHDIIFEHQAKGVKPFDRRFFQKYFPKYGRKAQTIITVSKFSKDDIIKTYKLPKDKIVVVYNGVGDQYKKVSNETKNEIKRRYTNGNSFFLFVGSLQPRKNISGLMKAFDEYKNSVSSNDTMKLLLVGNRHFWTSDMEKAYAEMKFKMDVIFAGRVNGDDLVDIYGATEALVYVPLIEGFGLPIVEGFKSEVPVITSNITSMPEVAGEAALLVDPYDYHDISKAMISIVSDIELRKKMILKGIEQAKLFSWDNSAKAIWSEIELVARG